MLAGEITANAGEWLLMVDGGSSYSWMYHAHWGISHIIQRCPIRHARIYQHFMHVCNMFVHSERCDMIAEKHRGTMLMCSEMIQGILPSAFGFKFFWLYSLHQYTRCVDPICSNFGTFPTNFSILISRTFYFVKVWLHLAGPAQPKLDLGDGDLLQGSEPNSEDWIVKK